MAKKLKLMPMFQELNGRAQITSRRPASASTGVYLMQLRAQTTATTLPRRRFMISVELQVSTALPHPVKIHHIGMHPQPAPDEGTSPTVVSAKVPHVRPGIG